jgi:hypothetical protein
MDKKSIEHLYYAQWDWMNEKDDIIINVKEMNRYNSEYNVRAHLSRYTFQGS